MNEFVKVLTNCILFPGAEVDVEALKSYFFRENLAGDVIQFFKAVCRVN